VRVGEKVSVCQMEAVRGGLEMIEGVADRVELGEGVIRLAP
jgi:hypothetical protein